MDNPFSAPAAPTRSVSPESSVLPPPLDDDSTENQAVEYSGLPPVRPELDIFPVPGTPANSLPPIQKVPVSQDNVEIEAITTPTVAPEFAESKIDLEQDDAVTPAVTSESETTVESDTETEWGDDEDKEEEHVLPQSPPPAPAPRGNTTPKSHHQPTSHASSVGWSDADFPDHEASDLPKLAMEEKSCRMCKYFHFEEETRSTARFGECRRSAPVGIGKALWPSVLWESWCGEWTIGVGQEEMMQMARSVADSIAER